MSREMRECLEWHERAGRGEVKPSLTFEGGRIRLLNRFGWPTLDLVSYDDLLRALSRHGGALHLEGFMYGAPKKTRAVLARHGLLPVYPIADWRRDRRRDVWCAPDPWGRELAFQTRGIDGVYRAGEPIRYAGYTNVWLERSIAFAVANELALGNRVDPFHFEDEEYEPNATALRISAALHAEDQRSFATIARSRGAVRRIGRNG